ncbi:MULTISPECIES: hypothetical protein [Streptomyces]|uniref:hypothetical protein n=1 Tax=Streptomyces TaxID=1883 RepID=UPI0036755810
MKQRDGVHGEYVCFGGAAGGGGPSSVVVGEVAAGPVRLDGERQSRVVVGCVRVLAVMPCAVASALSSSEGMESGMVALSGVNAERLHRAGQPEHGPVHAHALAAQAALMRV